MGLECGGFGVYFGAGLWAKRVDLKQEPFLGPDRPTGMYYYYQQEAPEEILPCMYVFLAEPSSVRASKLGSC